MTTQTPTADADLIASVRKDLVRRYTATVRWLAYADKISAHRAAALQGIELGDVRWLPTAIAAEREAMELAGKRPPMPSKAHKAHMYGSAGRLVSLLGRSYDTRPQDLAGIAQLIAETA